MRGPVLRRPRRLRRRPVRARMDDRDARGGRGAGGDGTPDGRAVRPGPSPPDGCSVEARSAWYVKYVLLFVDTEQFASDLQTMGLAERERAFQQADKWFPDHVGKLRGGSRLRSPGFDVTGSQFGVMLVPDQPRALREMVRVTRPGGRVLVIAYGSPAELEFLQVFIGALTAVAPEFPGLPHDPPPLEFQVSDPDDLHRRLTDAGLKDVRVERTAERPAFTSGQEMWDWVLYGNPIPGMLVADLTEDQRARLRQVLDGMLRERAGAKRPSRPGERGQHRHRDEMSCQAAIDRPHLWHGCQASRPICRAPSSTRPDRPLPAEFPQTGLGPGSTNQC